MLQCSVPKGDLHCQCILSIFPARVHQFYANLLVFVNINPFLYINDQFALGYVQYSQIIKKYGNHWNNPHPWYSSADKIWLFRPWAKIKLIENGEMSEHLCLKDLEGFWHYIYITYWLILIDKISGYNGFKYNVHKSSGMHIIKRNILDFGWVEFRQPKETDAVLIC